VIITGENVTAINNYFVSNVLSKKQFLNTSSIEDADKHNVAFLLPLLISAGVSVAIMLLCIIMYKVFHLNEIVKKFWETYYPEPIEG